MFFAIGMSLREDGTDTMTTGVSGQDDRTVEQWKGKNRRSSETAFQREEGISTGG